MYQKIILFTAALSVSSFLQANELMSYEQAENAIKAGHRITYVVDWEKCESNYPEVKLDNIASWTPSGIVVKKGVAISARGMTYSHVITSEPSLGPVNQAYDYIFYKDKGLEIINRFLDPKTYAEVIPAAKLNCKFGEAFRVFSI
jgi:hypothetical protein